MSVILETLPLHNLSLLSSGVRPASPSLKPDSQFHTSTSVVQCFWLCFYTVGCLGFGGMNFSRYGSMNRLEILAISLVIPCSYIISWIIFCYSLADFASTSPSHLSSKYLTSSAIELKFASFIKLLIIPPEPSFQGTSSNKLVLR